jgi:hypothetical protein
MLEGGLQSGRLRFPAQIENLQAGRLRFREGQDRSLRK